MRAISLNALLRNGINPAIAREVAQRYGAAVGIQCRACYTNGRWEIVSAYGRVGIDHVIGDLFDFDGPPPRDVV